MAKKKKNWNPLVDLTTQEIQNTLSHHQPSLSIRVDPTEPIPTRMGAIVSPLPTFVHPRHGPIKLGVPRRHEIDTRQLMFAKYATQLPPTPPRQAGYMLKVSNWDMDGNDRFGDCVEAGGAHHLQAMSTYAGQPFVPTEEQVLGWYSDVTGWNPNDPSTDQGTNPSDFMKYWRKHGLNGHTIRAYVYVNPLNHLEVKQAIALFGGVLQGWWLPISAQTPITGGNGFLRWVGSPNLVDPVYKPGGWGGHMTYTGAYYTPDVQGHSRTMTVTWGSIYDADWSFIDQYSDQVIAVVTDDFIQADGKSPSGFDISTLLQDLALVAS